MIKKRGSKFVVTNKSGTKVLGTHSSKEKAAKQLAAIEISKAKHMSENKRFKAFRSELNESEYKETLTGYPNRGIDTDVGAVKHDSDTVQKVNGVLAALGRYTYQHTSEALIKIRTRLNLFMLDFPWTPWMWQSNPVGTFTLPVTLFGRVDGVDGMSGNIRMDGKANPTAGIKEFALVVTVESAEDGFYRVNAKLQPQVGLVPESVEEDGETVTEAKGQEALAQQVVKQGKKIKKLKGAMKEETDQLDEAMTRKHFQQVADVIKSHPDAKKREELAKHHSEIFKKSNPRFDETRFRKACGVGGCQNESVEQIDEAGAAKLARMGYAYDRARIGSRGVNNPERKQQIGDAYYKQREKVEANKAKRVAAGTFDKGRELEAHKKRLDVIAAKRAAGKAGKDQVRVDESIVGKAAKKVKRFGQTVSAKLGIPGMKAKTGVEMVGLNTTPAEKKQDILWLRKERQKRKVRQKKNSSGVQEAADKSDDRTIGKFHGLYTDLHSTGKPRVITKDGKVVATYRKERSAIKHATTGKPVKEEVELDEMAQTPERSAEMRQKYKDEWLKGDTAARKVKAKDAAEKAHPTKLYGKGGKVVVETAEQIDELSKKTRDAYVAKRGSQLSSMLSGHTRGKQLTGKQQANAVKGIKRAMGVSEELVGGQTKLDVNKNKRLDAQDFAMLRAKKKPVKEETVAEAKKMKTWTPRLDRLMTNRDAIRSKPKKTILTQKVQDGKKIGSPRAIPAFQEKKTVKEYTETMGGIPLTSPDPTAAMADKSGKGKRFHKKALISVKEAVAKAKKTKKPSPRQGAANVIGKYKAIKSRLEKHDMRW